MSSVRARTVADLLRDRADAPRSPAYHFYADDCCSKTTISYGELHDQAARIGASLQRYAAGQRVVVAMPTGPGFLRAFFAALHAGLMVVPVPQLQPARGSRLRQRSIAIIRDADPVAVFLPWDQHERERDDLPGVDLYDPDRLGDFPDVSSGRSVSAEAPALLQFSSGTGGRPKGIVLSHRAILSNLEAIREAFGHSTESRGLTWLPPFHDMGLVGGLLQPLYAGFPVCVMRPDSFARKPLRWLQAISTFGATTSGGPCAAYEACIRAYQTGKHADVLADLDLSTWDVPFVGAEPIHADTLQRFGALFRSHGFRPERFLPCYGLAESTLMVTAHPRGTPLELDAVERGRSVVSCGSALSPTQVVIVDPVSQTEVGDGVTGEVWIAGPSLATGYFNQRDGTAPTFGAHSASRPGEQFLRTGDLGFVKRRRLFITGRLKNLVIVNGQNYEPELLEQAILESCGGDSVHSLLVLANDGPGSQIVVLVEVDHRRPRAELAAIEPRIRRVLAEEFELSISEVKLLKRGALARTSSGKLRRLENESAYRLGAFAAFEASRHGATPEAAPVSAALEDALVELIARELAASARACREAEALAALGMDSLKALSLQERILEELGVEVPLLDLLTGSVAELARRARTVDSVAVGEAPYELSPVQRALWFAHQLDPGVGAFNIGCSVSFEQRVEVDLLTQAARAVLSAHPELRARYRTRDGVVTKELCDDLDLRIEYLTSDEQAFRRKPFDLEAPPLMRVGVAMREAGFRLVVMVHHIASDHASVAIVVEQLCETYRALTVGQEPLDLREPPGLFTAARAAAGAAKAPPVELSRLFTDRPRGDWTWQVASRRRIVDTTLLQALGAAASELGVTQHALVMAGLMALLHRYTAEATITVASPLSFRSVAPSRGVGCFVALVPVSVEVEGSRTLADLAAAITRQITAAIEHQRGASQPAGSTASIPTTGQAPIANVVFAYYPDVSPPRGADACWRVESTSDNAAIFELFLSVSRVAGETVLTATYASDLFERETVDDLLGHFLALLAAGARQPRASLRALVLGAATPPLPTAQDEAFSPVGALFAEQVERTPERVAIVYRSEHVSYVRLRRQAVDFMSRLQQLGIGRETAVGIHLTRNPRLVAVLLAVLDCGATSVPMDPSLPRERLERMIRDAHVEYVITESSERTRFEGCGARLVLLDEEPGSSSEQPRRREIHAEQLAYILYTSGSTGAPKGVAIRHAGLSNLMHWSSGFFSGGAAQGVFASTSLGFDLSVFELLGPLCHGGTVVLGDTAFDLTAAPARHAVTLVNTVPSALSALLPSLPRSVHTVNLAGEPLAPSLLRDLFRKRHVARVFNLYGPSEDTTYSTARRFDEAIEVVSIGSSLPGKMAFVCDELLRSVPVGMPGELCLSGRGLARGYAHAPRATARSFVPNPHARKAGERLYRTGDRVRRCADGDLRFHGRIDRQVKLRGFRIELTEIEHVINQVAGVVTSAVIVDDRVADRRVLLAFVVAPGDVDGNVFEQIRRRTQELLPPYMVPQRVVALDNLPIGTNGKLDRLMLFAALEETSTLPVAPCSALERETLAWWQRSLATSKIGVDDNLFFHGADSLLLLRWVGEVSDRYDVKLSVKDAFRCSSVASVCKLIEERRPNQAARLDALLRRVESLSDEEASRMLEGVEGGER